MMSRHVLVAALAACAGAWVACSSGSANLCQERSVRCADDGTLCDPEDGVCKCGGRGGVVCDEDEVCDVLANTCVSNRCANVDCQALPGTSCDVRDGVCRCGGTGGTVCASNEACNPNARACELVSDCNEVACPRNQVCEPSTGQCLCNGEACGAGQTCSVTGASTVCVDDNCSGVVCTGATTCDAEDGYCKCNSEVCQSGQACGCPAGSDGGCAAPAKACRISDLCLGVSCGNGTTCDPADGQCRCGGPGGPACSANQICNLGPPPRCEGGEQCVTADGGIKICDNGTSCDPEDGVCKCGGRGGVPCEAAGVDGNGQLVPAEVCVSNLVQVVCRRPCDIINPSCAAGTYCYHDSSATPAVSYCAVPGGTQISGAGCTTPTACFQASPVPHSLHCLGLALGQTGLCRAYCDVSVGQSGCLQDVPRSCQQIPGAPVNVGYCHPIN